MKSNNIYYVTSAFSFIENAQITNNISRYCLTLLLL